MKTLLIKLFVEHWPRKLVAIILAVITWLVVNHTLTSTRNISNIPVRVLNLPSGKTIEGMQPNGRLAKKLTLTLVGNRSMIDALTPSDLEVIIDAADKPDEWIVIVSKKNLVSLNPEIDISNGISRVYHPNFIVRMTKLITDQIPIVITRPIGEAPRGYQFLDVWPYRLMLTVSGPEEVIRRLKIKEQKITFNLNDISKSQLDELSRKTEEGKTDLVTFFVPDQWKQVYIPLLSEQPIEIDDPQAKALRVDFIRYSQLPLNSPLPLSLFFPPQNLSSFNPENIRIAPGPIVKFIEGAPLINTPLFVSGVDSLFLEIVREMIELVIMVSPKSERSPLEWSVQFINQRQLEDQYVATLISDASDQEIQLMQPTLKEGYLRNRFRSYMNRFQLFETNEKRFEMAPFLRDSKIHIEREEVPASIRHP